MARRLLTFLCGRHQNTTLLYPRLWRSCPGRAVARGPKPKTCPFVRDERDRQGRGRDRSPSRRSQWRNSRGFEEQPRVSGGSLPRTRRFVVRSHESGRTCPSPAILRRPRTGAVPGAPPPASPGRAGGPPRTPPAETTRRARGTSLPSSRLRREPPGTGGVRPDAARLLCRAAGGRAGGRSGRDAGRFGCPRLPPAAECWVALGSSVRGAYPQ